jgi:hypothetical protein
VPEDHHVSQISFLPPMDVDPQELVASQVVLRKVVHQEEDQQDSGVLV